MNNGRFDKYFRFGVSLCVFFFNNLLLHVLFPNNSYHAHDIEPIHVKSGAKFTPILRKCFCHSKTPFKCIEDPIINQITQSFVLRGL